MSDLDLVALRQSAAAAAVDPYAQVVDAEQTLTLIDRIEMLEARLARVTGDSMLAGLMRVQYTGHGRGKPEVMRDVLSLIRAVAAQNEQGGDDRG